MFLWNLIFLQPFVHLPIFVKLRRNLSHPLGKIRGSLRKRITPERNPIFKSYKGLPVAISSHSVRVSEGNVLPISASSTFIYFLCFIPAVFHALSVCLRFRGTLTFAHSLHRQSFLKPTLFVSVTVHFLLSPFPASSCAHNVCAHKPP